MPREGEKGTGKSTSAQMIAAIDWALANNNDKNSPFYGKVDTSKIAVSGMSCGGLQTLEVAPDPRVTTVLFLFADIKLALSDQYGQSTTGT
jgi:dienelactone hydrolase